MKSGTATLTDKGQIILRRRSQAVGGGNQRSAGGRRRRSRVGAAKRLPTDFLIGAHALLRTGQLYS